MLTACDAETTLTSNNFPSGNELDAPVGTVAIYMPACPQRNLVPRDLKTLDEQVNFACPAMPGLIAAALMQGHQKFIMIPENGSLPMNFTLGTFHVFDLSESSTTPSFYEPFLQRSAERDATYRVFLSSPHIAATNVQFSGNSTVTSYGADITLAIWRIDTGKFIGFREINEPDLATSKEPYFRELVGMAQDIAVTLGGNDELTFYQDPHRAIADMAPASPQ